MAYILLEVKNDESIDLKILSGSGLSPTVNLASVTRLNNRQ